MIEISEPANQVCTYLFQINTKWACPIPKDGKGDEIDGLSPGSVFLIIFFVGFAVYFAVGAVVKFKVYSATGVELIPNTMFWLGLPGLIRV